jgi:hypothetical protein
VDQNRCFIVSLISLHCMCRKQLESPEQRKRLKRKNSKPEEASAGAIDDDLDGESAAKARVAQTDSDASENSDAESVASIDSCKY